MGLKGGFSRWSSPNVGGGMIQWQFVLRNTNMMFGETVDVMLCDCYGQRPYYFRNIKLKAGEAVSFNKATADWEWCQDDFAAILGPKDKIVTKWQFHLKEYRPGECPECHGTQKCRYCRGQGVVYPRNEIWNFQSCGSCGGTGVCQTCYIPRRPYRPGGASAAAMPGMQGGSAGGGKQVENLRRAIADVQEKIDKTKWDMRMMQLKDMDAKHSGVYMSYNQLLHQYNIQLINLQSQLTQLEQMQ